VNAAHEPVEAQQRAPGDDREVLDVKAAAALLGCDRHLIYQLVQQGTISVIRLGPQTWRFVRSRLLSEIQAIADDPVKGGTK
jgi:excisionase family DNA binding protein